MQREKIRKQAHRKFLEKKTTERNSHPSAIHSSRCFMSSEWAKPVDSDNISCLLHRFTQNTTQGALKSDSCFSATDFPFPMSRPLQCYEQRSVEDILTFIVHLFQNCCHWILETLTAKMIQNDPPFVCHRKSQPIDFWRKNNADRAVFYRLVVIYIHYSTQSHFGRSEIVWALA